MSRPGSYILSLSHLLIMRSGRIAMSERRIGKESSALPVAVNGIQQKPRRITTLKTNPLAFAEVHTGRSLVHPLDLAGDPGGRRRRIRLRHRNGQIFPQQPKINSLQKIRCLSGMARSFESLL